MYANVVFDSKSTREYCYYVPPSIDVCVGDTLLVSVYGDIKAVKVIDANVSPPAGMEIKSVVGFGVLLEQLSETPAPKRSILTSLFGTSP